MQLVSWQVSQSANQAIIRGTTWFTCVPAGQAANDYVHQLQPNMFRSLVRARVHYDRHGDFRVLLWIRVVKPATTQISLLPLAPIFPQQVPERFLTQSLLAAFTSIPRAYPQTVFTAILRTGYPCSFPQGRLRRIHNHLRNKFRIHFSSLLISRNPISFSICLSASQGVTPQASLVVSPSISPWLCSAKSSALPA